MPINRFAPKCLVLTMLKQILFSAIVLGASVAFGQVQSGTLVDSGRKCLTASPNFQLDGSSEGTIVVELAVNREGVVTGTKIISELTTVSSTPLLMRAQNTAKKLTFTAGTRYAAFEHVRIKYTVKKKAS